MSDETEIPYGYCHCGCGQKTRIATCTSKQYKSKRGEPRRYVNGHASRKPAMQRFLAKFEKTESCWLWIASTRGAKSKYGRFRLKDKPISAHAASYILFIGDIPSGFEVCHTCDVPLCVNPEHLFLGTRADNMRDMVKKNRHRAVTMPETIAHGTEHHNSKLTENEVLEIVQSYKNGESSYQIARRMPVNPRTIRKIVNGQLWNWLTRVKTG